MPGDHQTELREIAQNSTISVYCQSRSRLIALEIEIRTLPKFSGSELCIKKWKHEARRGASGAECRCDDPDAGS